VRLNSLHLVNFRQHANTRVSFDSGLTGVIGANGSGKTTVLEAIGWALYGNPAARGKRESIRFARAGARASVRVELDFSLGGHRYRVARGLTSAELYLDGADQPIANSTTGVTELLQRRLGMSRAEFFNTYFTGQKELNVMAAMKPVERAQFVSRVLGYERLRTAQGLAREKRNLLRAEVVGLQQAMPEAASVARAAEDAEARLAATEVRARAAALARASSAAALAAVAPRWELAQRERERAAAAEGDLRVAENDVVGLERDLARIDRELAELGSAGLELAALREQLAPLAALKIELRQLDEMYRNEGRRQTLAESERAAREDLARLAVRRERIARAPELERAAAAELEARRAEFDAAQRAFEAKQGEWVRDQQEASTKLDSLRAHWTELKQQRDQVMALGEQSPCPTCTRPLGASFRVVVEDLDDKIDTLKVDGKFYGQRVTQLAQSPEEVAALDARRKALTADVNALERRLAKCQSASQELEQIAKEVAQKEQRLAAVAADIAAIPGGYDAARHAAVRRDVDALGPVDARAARLAALTERLAQRQAERERAGRALDGARERRADALERRRAIDFSEDAFAALRLDFTRASEAVRAAELDEVAASTDARAAREALAVALAARQEYDRARGKLEQLQQDKRLHDELDRAYTELRDDLNMALRPELSELAGAFLEDLTDARYSQLELDDEYNLIVLEDGVPKPVISGGEEDLANLVLRLAISQMIAERAGQQFSLLILDEVFGSLDEQRRSNVIELLRRLHDRFEQVILITHIESVREGLDRVITVRYNEETGASSVEQTDAGGDSDPGDGAGEDLRSPFGEGSSLAASGEAA
jgi:exonuclease SbcC